MNNIWFDKLHPNQARKRDKLALFVAFITLGLLAPVFVLYREYEQVCYNFLLKKINPIFLGRSW